MRIHPNSAKKISSTSCNTYDFSSLKLFAKKSLPANSATFQISRRVTKKNVSNGDTPLACVDGVSRSILGATKKNLSFTQLSFEHSSLYYFMLAWMQYFSLLSPVNIEISFRTCQAFTYSVLVTKPLNFINNRFLWN